MSQWQNIETAPKDGSVILLAKDGEVFSGWYCNDAFGYCWWFIDDTDIEVSSDLETDVIVPNAWDVNHAPSHWMPLPAAPRAMNEELESNP